MTMYRYVLHTHTFFSYINVESLIKQSEFVQQVILILSKLGGSFKKDLLASIVGFSEGFISVGGTSS